MNIFDALTMLGGLCLFLFGMNLMGEALERTAGNSLRSLLGKLTNRRMMGFLTGLAVTAVIQSSSATTVMVVGFVNSGLMTLKQAINVIMGANVGTTATAWLLSLSGIDGSNLFVKLLKPTSFTPVLALIGIVFYLFLKNSRKKDIGMILLGFATLMFGMDTMSDAVSGLRDVPAFQQLFVLFRNPVLGVLAGAILTAVIQSSSASVGILQALASTGQVTFGAAIPIIMGQNIGTCVTAMLSSVGANKNAKRAALVHLCFNVIGTIVCLALFMAVRALFAPVLLDRAADYMGIAVAHSVFNVLCTALLMPMGGLLEKLATMLVPDAKTPDVVSELDERLMDVPSIALERTHEMAADMGKCAVQTLRDAIAALTDYTPAAAESIREGEKNTDHYEDLLGSYLVKLSARKLSAAESQEAAMLLKVIGDFERISDHGVNILESAEEMAEKELSLSGKATEELRVLTTAVDEILELALQSFLTGKQLDQVEALEQVIDERKETLRSNHIGRLQRGECTIEVGFVWTDLLTNLERTADHCSNIAGCVMDLRRHDMNMHENLRAWKRDSEAFRENLERYEKKYAL